MLPTGVSGVIVPFDGVEAKLSMARRPLAAQSRSAANTRGWIALDLEMEIFFMML